jgi:ubiquinone/menaquinone biosynthesis C-methylase UbiE
MDSSSDAYEELMSIYDSIASSYSSLRSAAWGVVDELSSSDGWVADVGCGPCQNGVRFSLRSRSKLVCLDISYEMLRQSKVMIGGLGDDLVVRSNHVQADMRSLPLRELSVDRVLLIASINHIHPKDLGVVLSEFYRVLKGGGEGLITLWALTHPVVLRHVLKNLIKSLFNPRNLGNVFDIRVPWRSKGRVFLRYYHIYRVREVLKCLRGLGFNIVKVGVYNPHKRLLPENYYVLLRK